MAESALTVALMLFVMLAAVGGVFGIMAAVEELDDRRRAKRNGMELAAARAKDLESVLEEIRSAAEKGDQLDITAEQVLRILRKHDARERALRSDRR